MARSPSVLASWDACVDHTGPWIAKPTLGHLRSVPAGTLLYDQCSPHRYFYLIREGFVRCSMLHSSGRRLLLELMGPGTMFGEGAAFDGHPRYVHAETVSDVRFSVYKKEDVLGDPDPAALLQSIIKIMASKQRVLAGKLLEFNSEDPEGRLRHLLAKLVAVQRRASPEDERRAAQVWLSQESLAEMCGMSRISAARALRRLAEAGLVRSRARHVEVLDAQSLSGPTP